MTHDKLLAALAYTPHTDPNGAKMHAALRAVVELHTPTDNGFYCELCISSNFEYPCPTIEAIEKELK
jgi:hypothetical protein